MLLNFFVRRRRRSDSPRPRVLAGAVYRDRVSRPGIPQPSIYQRREEPERPEQPELTPHGRILVTPRLDAALTAIENEARRQGGTITWTSGYRSPADQARLQRAWELGDPGVPFEPLPYSASKHATGQAADGEASSQALAYHLGAYAQELGLRWSPVEPWHFELRTRATEVGR